MIRVKERSVRYRANVSYPQYCRQCRDSSRKHCRMAGGAQEVCSLGTRRTRGRIASTSWIGTRCAQYTRGSIVETLYSVRGMGQLSLLSSQCVAPIAILIRPHRNPIRVRPARLTAHRRKRAVSASCVPLVRTSHSSPADSVAAVASLLQQLRGRGRGAVDYKLAE